MSITYLCAQSECELPDISELRPFRAVVVIDENISRDYMEKISRWLVKSACLYAMTWGKQCEQTHDMIDFANLEAFGFQEIPEDKFMMTTWHENEPLSEVFWYSKNCAFHPSVDLPQVLLLHISMTDRQEQFLSEYQTA
jgi:hypothetical protein